MLASTRHSHDVDSDIDSVHNYYERLVLQQILNTSARVQQGDREFYADVACVALNRLPPRYIRHDVDMTFFMSPQEMAEVETKVTNAVQAAIDYVESRERGEPAPAAKPARKAASPKKSTATKTKTASKKKNPKSQ